MVPLSSLESLKKWAMKFHAHLFEESTPKSQSEQIALSWLIDLFLFTCIHGVMLQTMELLSCCSMSVLALIMCYSQWLCGWAVQLSKTRVPGSEDLDAIFLHLKLSQGQFIFEHHGSLEWNLLYTSEQSLWHL